MKLPGIWCSKLREEFGKQLVSSGISDLEVKDWGTLLADHTSLLNWHGDFSPVSAEKWTRGQRRLTVPDPGVVVANSDISLWSSNRWTRIGLALGRQWFVFLKVDIKLQKRASLRNISFAVKWKIYADVLVGNCGEISSRLWATDLYFKRLTWNLLYKCRCRQSEIVRLVDTYSSAKIIGFIVRSETANRLITSRQLICRLRRTLNRTYCGDVISSRDSPNIAGFPDQNYLYKSIVCAHGHWPKIIGTSEHHNEIKHRSWAA